MKKISIFILTFLFIIFGFIFKPEEKECYVKEVISPTEFILSNGKLYSLKGVNCFDGYYSEKNKSLAEKFGITEKEAFISGNLGKYWAKNILEGREVKPVNNDLVYFKYSYYSRFLNSPYCIKDDGFTNKFAFQKHLEMIRRAKFLVIENGFHDYLVLRKNYYNKNLTESKNTDKCYLSTANLGNIKLLVSDLTLKLKPDRECTNDMCKEILNNINNAQKSIDIAIYGYSSVPEIENAIKNALKRGVKIRLVYDTDSKGGNIYPDTNKLAAIIPDNKSDKFSNGSNNIMHNKFYIFDDKTVITGSANLSHTDMSGFNSNNLILINSPQITKIYEKEFNQMYEGKFHTDKTSIDNRIYENIEIYFSPQDSPLTNGVIPRIKKAEKYIYIPAFFITDYKFSEELISAKKRGVDVRIITDALSASNKYSKHEEMRRAGISVKTENYAGKMHTKTIVLDDEYIIMGSMNFSYSGNNKNDENLIVLKNKEAAVFLKNFFLYLWNKIPDKWLRYNASAESKDSIGSCSDGIDNDYDGYTDMEDSACKNLK